MITPKRGEDVPSLVEMGERMSAYSDHPAFAGLYVVDEPWYPGFSKGGSERLIDTCAPLYNRLAEMGIVGYNNLLPTYAEEDLSLYPKYVEYFLEACDVPYIMYDYYVFDEGRSVEDYFYNMAVVRSYAEKYKIPFWTFIQAGSQWNDAMNYFDSQSYYPNEKQFDWNINTCLAYGAKGLGYFPMVQPLHFAYAKSTEWDFERNGIFGAWGNKTRWYYYAQDINKHVAVIDEVLMNSVSKGVIAALDKETYERDMKDLTKENYVDTSKLFIEGTSWRELADVKGNALIGCFNYQGKTALYVVNYEFDYAQKIDLQFVKECNVKVVQAAETSYVKTDNLVLDMPAGDGVLLVFE